MHFYKIIILIIAINYKLIAKISKFGSMSNKLTVRHIAESHTDFDVFMILAGRLKQLAVVVINSSLTIGY